MTHVPTTLTDADPSYTLELEAFEQQADLCSEDDLGGAPMVTILTIIKDSK